MIPDSVIFFDIRPIQNEVRGEYGLGIPVYRIDTVFLFVVLNNRCIKDVILKDSLYVLGLITFLCSWSKLKSLNEPYF
jgi:hypothetical protein